MSVWTNVWARTAIAAGMVTLLVYFGGLWLTSSLSKATRVDQCLQKIGFENGPPSSVPVELSTTYFPVRSVCTWPGYERVEVATPVVNSLVPGLLAVTVIAAALAVCSHVFSRRRQPAT
jgi:hypothetical protein